MFHVASKNKLFTHEKRFGKATHLTETNGIQALRVKTGDITSIPNNIAKVLLENNYIGVYHGVIFHITP